ncbi:MAG: glycosyltransferase family 4 protein [Actinomycetota bacterium]|nr:glycosyltransferase family 4 protein [Actinomycetota bacterium]
MRVVHVVSTMESAHNYVDLVAELTGAGIDVHVLLGNAEPTPVETDLSDAGAEVVRLGLRLHDFGSALRAAPRVRSEVRRRRPSIVHGHFLGGSIAAAWASIALPSARFIHTRHHADFHHEHARKGVAFDRMVNRLSEHIVAISPVVEEVLRDREGVAAGRVSVIEHGVRVERYRDVVDRDVAAFRRRVGLEGPGPVVGVCSRMINGKGCDVIIDAMKGVWASVPDARLLWLNARGPLAPGLRTELGGDERVRLVEFEHDMAAAFAAMDVFVHIPTRRTAEAFGFVYAEAMASGVPCVFTEAGAIAGRLTDGVHAHLVGHRDAEVTATAVLGLLGDPDHARQVAHAGRSVADERFTVVREAAEHARLYGQLLGA